MLTITPDFLFRSMRCVLEQVDNVALYRMEHDEKAYNDTSRYNEIAKACKEAYDGSKGKVVMPFLYLQSGSDRYPYEVVKVYRNEKGLPSMIVVREMKWEHGCYDETSEVTGSDPNGETCILKKVRGKSAWKEVGEHHSYFYESVVPESYYDPNF